MTEISTFTIFFLVFTALYIFSALYLLIHHPPKRPKNPEKKYKAAVLIAVRNEEKYLPGCLQALANQDYDEKLYDIYILDDDSKDNSAAIAKKFCRTHPNFHYRHINNSIAALKGKMNVLAQGLAGLDCDIVLITDADCIVPPTWIRSITAYFDRNTGLVGALTSLTPLKGINISFNEKLFHKVQTIDWLFLQAVARFSSNAGKPLTVLGNNFAFSLTAYIETGGFEKIAFSITEDYALLRAIEKTGHWKIKHINDPGAAVFSYPLNTLTDFLMQRARWIRGGRSARPWAYFLMLISFVTHLSALAVLIIKPFNIFNLLAFCLLLLMDYQMIKKDIINLRLKRLKPFFILFEFFYMIYTLIFSLYFIFPVKTNWKGRNL